MTVRAVGILAQRVDTPRLVLRRPQRGDAPAMAALLNDWDVARWLAQVPFPYTERDARDWIAQCARNWNRGINYQFAVVARAREGGERVIGHIGLRRSAEDLASGSAELGYWFGRGHWGSGFGTEAARAAIGFGFDELGLARIWATALPDNDRSLKVLGKAGMVPVGTTMQTYATRNATLEVPVLAVERTGWRAFTAGDAAGRGR
ncbi:MAG: GNAT family N-acetyltransferase [Azospirillaceae bacterium]